MLLSKVDIASAYNSVNDIETCYYNIIDCLSKAAMVCVPTIKSDLFKFWWDEELD